MCKSVALAAVNVKPPKKREEIMFPRVDLILCYHLARNRRDTKERECQKLHVVGVVFQPLSS